MAELEDFFQNKLTPENCEEATRSFAAACKTLGPHALAALLDIASPNVKPIQLYSCLFEDLQEVDVEGDTADHVAVLLGRANGDGHLNAEEKRMLLVACCNYLGQAKVTHPVMWDAALALMPKDDTLQSRLVSMRVVANAMGGIVDQPVQWSALMKATIGNECTLSTFKKMVAELDGLNVSLHAWLALDRLIDEYQLGPEATSSLFKGIFSEAQDLQDVSELVKYMGKDRFLNGLRSAFGDQPPPGAEIIEQVVHEPLLSADAISLGQLRDTLRSDLSPKERMAFREMAPKLLAGCRVDEGDDEAKAGYLQFVRMVLPPGQRTLKTFANLVTMLARVNDMSSSSWKAIHDFLVAECDFGVEGRIALFKAIFSRPQRGMDVALLIDELGTRAFLEGFELTFKDDAQNEVWTVFAECMRRYFASHREGSVARICRCAKSITATKILLESMVQRDPNFLLFADENFRVGLLRLGMNELNFDGKFSAQFQQLVLAMLRPTGQPAVLHLCIQGLDPQSVSLARSRAADASVALLHYLADEICLQLCSNPASLVLLANQSVGWTFVVICLMQSSKWPSVHGSLEVWASEHAADVATVDRILSRSRDWMLDAMEFHKDCGYINVNLDVIFIGILLTSVDGATQDQHDVAWYLSGLSTDRVHAILDHPDAHELEDLAMQVYGRPLIEVIEGLPH